MKRYYSIRIGSEYTKEYFQKKMEAKVRRNELIAQEKNAFVTKGPDHPRK